MLCPAFETAKRLPGACALETDELRLTYLELDQALSSFCAELHARGVKKSDRVGFIATSSWQTVLLFFALFRLGAVACPMSFRLPDEARVALQDELTLDHFVEPESLHVTDAKLVIHEIDENEIALLMPTSGSSGNAKLAALSFQNLYLSALGSTELLPLVEEDRWLLSLPLFHVGGVAILMRAFYAGLCLSLTSLPLHEALLQKRIDFLSLVPTQLYRLVHHSSFPPLKGVLLGGAAFSSSLLETALKKGYPVFTSYGLTEMASQVTLDLSPKKGSSGFVLPYRELKITNEEICVKGETLFQGYWNKNEGLVLPIDGDGWFHTRDRGKFGENGELLVLGRLDSLFISGGENIYPEEIEAALLSLPEILEAVVIPLYDEEFGERPAAFISTSTAVPEEKILQRLRKTLPGFMVPKRLYQLPADQALKRNRKMLRELAQNLI